MTTRRARQQTRTAAKGDHAAHLAALRSILQSEQAGTVRYRTLEWALGSLAQLHVHTLTLEKLVTKLKGELGDG